MRFCWGCIAIAMGFAATAMADAPTTQPALGPADTFRAFLLDVKAGNADDLVKLSRLNRMMLASWRKTSGPFPPPWAICARR